MQMLSERPIEGSTMNWEHVPFPSLSDSQFMLWQALLEERTGMFVPYERKSLMQSNLTIRMREINCRDFDEYYRKVLAKPSGILEWSILVDRLTVQETRFYRNPDSLMLVEKFLDSRYDRQHDPTPLNIWSVGCSTGEEPYTLAIIADDICHRRETRPLYGVSATDISLPALQKAREARYSSRKLLDLRHEWLDRYFDQLDRGTYQVKESIAERVCFSMANMVDIENSPLRNMDLIYCQNVLIYFRKERKYEILDRLVDRLSPGGVLIIGQGEATAWRNSLVTRVPEYQTLAYMRQEPLMS